MSDKPKSGKGPKGKYSFVFVRFGGLNLKIQKGYSASPKSFHAPPAPRGIYAMPKIAQEMFLVSSIDDFQPGIMPKQKKQPEGLTLEEEEKFWSDHEKRRVEARSKIRKEFEKRKGNIWHHLEETTKPSEIIDRHGSWVKTDMDAWQKAFTKQSMLNRYGEDFFASKSINSGKGIFGYYSKDHLEVFFDEKC